MVVTRRAGVGAVVARTGHAGLVLLASVVDLVLWGGDRTLRWGDTAPLGVLLASAAIVFALLLVRRTRPWLVYGVAWLYTVGWGAALPSYQPFAALLFALHQLALGQRALRAALALAAAAVPVGVNVANLTQLSSLEPAETAVSSLLWCVLVGAVWVAGRFGHAARRSAELREARQRAEASLSVIEERLRLARDLHDIVAHSVTAIVLQAGGYRQSARGLDERTQHALELIEDTGTRAMRELRTLLGLMHNPLGPSTPTSLADLDDLVRTTRSCGVPVEVSQHGHPWTLPEETGTAAYHVVQEALANVTSHGGDGATVEVQLRWRRDALDLVVESRQPTPGTDRDRGSDTGFGLAGLRTRVAGVGATLTHGWAGPDSYRLAAQFPRAGLPVAEMSGDDDR